MRKSLWLIVAALAAAALTSSSALAASSHFVGTPSCSISQTTGVLTCSGKAAGLGNGPVTANLTFTSITATYVCVNHGGNIAPGQGTFSGPSSSDPVTIDPRNGQITFSVTEQPPATPTSAQAGCPSGKWTVQRTSLCYNGVVLHLYQDGVEVLTKSLGDYCIPPAV